MRDRILRNAKLVIFLAALLPRLILPAIGFNGVAPDSGENMAMARGIVEGNGMIDHEGRPTAIRPPVYPLLLAGIQTLFGLEPRAVQITQGFVGALVAVALYEMLLGAIGARRALVAGLIFALDPVSIPSAAYILTETFGTALIVLWISAWYRTRSGTAGSYAWAGLLGGTIIYQTMITLLLHPLMLVARSLARPRLLPKIALSALIFLMPLAIWTTRNLFVVGEGTAVRSHGFGFLLWGTMNYDFDWLPSPYDPDAEYIFVHRDRVLEHYSLVEEHAVYMRKGVRRFLAEPFGGSIRCVKAVFWALAEVPGAMKTLDEMPFVKWALRAANAAIVLAGLYGTFFALRRREGFLLVGTIAYFLIFLAPLFPIPRYFIPIRPLFAATAACIGLRRNPPCAG